MRFIFHEYRNMKSQNEMRSNLDYESSVGNRVCANGSKAFDGPIAEKKR